MKVGYARIYSHSQDPIKKVTILKNYGCDKVHREKRDLTKALSPTLNRIRKELRKGDELVVHRFQEISRYRGVLMGFITQLNKQGIAVHCIDENITHVGQDT